MDESNSSNLELFLQHFVQTKDVNWLNLFVFEYCRHVAKEEEAEQPMFMDSERYKILSSQLPYRLPWLLFATFPAITDSVGDDESLRHYATRSTGGKILLLFSDLDLDLSNMGTERELVDAFSSLFPTKRWEEECSTEFKLPTTPWRSDARGVFKLIKFSTKFLEPPPKKKREPADFSWLFSSNSSDDTERVCSNYEQYESDEYRAFLESFRLSAMELAMKILRFFCKMVLDEDFFIITNSFASIRAMNFAVEKLKKFADFDASSNFTESERSVIKFQLLELVFRSFGNLLRCKDDSLLSLEYPKLLDLLEISCDADVVCGAMIAAISVTAQCCIKKCRNHFKLRDELAKRTNTVLEKMTFLKANPDYLYAVQRTLIGILRSTKKTANMSQCRKPGNDSSLLHHSHLPHYHIQQQQHRNELCIFERLLIDSIANVTKYKHLGGIMIYLRGEGICCCNCNIETIRFFLRSSTIPSQFLNFLERRVLRVIFTRDCTHCKQLQKSTDFQGEYFELIKEEIERRQGYELQLFLHHLAKINRFMPRDFQNEFVMKTIVPTFISEKTIFLNDPESNPVSKLITHYSLQIICRSAKNKSLLENLLTDEMVSHLRDCSLVPLLSANACMVLQSGIMHLSADKSQHMKSILFTNAQYLISEITNIYKEIGLPEDISQGTNSNASSRSNKAEAGDFEILNEQAVMVRENLSNMDVLLLNAIHWRVLCDLGRKHSSFQNDLVANTGSNFNGNVFFAIALSALKSMLKKDSTSVRSAPKNEWKASGNTYERCDYLSPILIARYDINYDLIMERSYKLFEICQNFTDKLAGGGDDTQNRNGNEHSFTTIYSTRRDKRVTFKITTIHRDNFLTDNIEQHMIKPPSNDLEKQSPSSPSHHWIDTFKMGIGKLESMNIRDAFVKIVNRFFRADEELRAMYRANAIREITNTFGLKYFSSIAKSCFDLSCRLTDDTKMSLKMSSALEELRLLLLQDEWSENSEALVEVLQLLLSVAEVRVHSVNQLNLENHLSFEPTLSLGAHHRLSDTKQLHSVFSDSEDDDDDDYDRSSEEDKRTEVYFTADENYDADEEYFFSAVECSRLSQKTLPGTTAVLYQRRPSETICKLVVEILMDLSRKCAENADECNAELLTTLVKRLSCMRSFLSGPEVLLQGFSPLLMDNNVKLRDLQKSILGLIGNLSTPESLRIFFSLLTVNTAPVELLISRLRDICNQQLALTTFSSVQYPICSSDATVTSTCDTYIHRSILSYREIHLNHKLLTPFTEASQIIPLNFLDLKMWNSEGFTLSTWINMEVDNGESSEIHLLSFGSDRLLLSVFLDENGCFNFNIMKPNQNLTHHGKMKGNKPVTDNQNSATADAPDKENINRTNIFGIASAIMKDREPPNIRTRSSLRNSMNKSKEEETSRRMETSKVSVTSKKLRVLCDQWTHVCLSLKVVDSQLSVLLTLNGTSHENVEIPMDEEMLNSDANGMLQLLFLGAQKIVMSDRNAECDLSYKMSNVLLFKIPLESHLITNLYALGPDCVNFVACEIKQIIPLREYVNLNLAYRSLLKSGLTDLFHRLQSNLILSYAIGKTNYATAFMDRKSEHGKTLDIFSIGRIAKATPIASLQRAVFYSGGLSSLLFMFARTVELTEDPDTQSSSLFIFLKIAHSNNYLYAEFEQREMFSLVAHVFKHGNCYRGPGMLKAILDVIYGGTVFLRRSKMDPYEIDERSELNIQNPSLLMKLLSHFNIFHAPDNAEEDVLELLFKSLITAVRDSHPFKRVNRECLADHGFFGRIIEFCKIHLGSTNCKTKITPSTALIVIDLLKMLSKKPPTLWSLSEIQKLQMLLHHPSESFITHDRSKFSFVLPSQKPSKSKSNSSIISSKYFNFSTKIRSTSISASVPSSPSLSHRSSIAAANNSTPPKSPRLFASTEGTSLFMETESKVSRNSEILPATRKFKARTFDELPEHQISQMTAALRESKCRRDLKTPTKMQTKRLKSTPKSSPYRKTSTPLKQRKRRSQEEEEADEVDQKLIEKFEILMSSSNLNLSECENDHTETGVSVLQEHLFRMLRDAVFLLDDTRAQHELPDCFKIESLIMFANNHDPNVRAAIISLIHAITKRQSADLINSYNKLNLWLHLANQLAISPINLKMLQATIDWIGLEDKMPIDDIMRAQVIEKENLKFKPAFRVLIATLPSMVHDVQLLKCCSKFLRLIIESHNDCFHLLIEYGLITCCIKALAKISEECLIEPIQLMLEQIAAKSFKHTGSMHILWELLYGLTYAERQNKSEFIREIHIAILRQRLAECLVEDTRRGSRIGSDVLRPPNLMVTKILGNLPTSEIKTRYSLLHDRAVQFVLSWECVDELRSSEMDFVKYLIDLYFCGMQQGPTLILWSLNPACCDEMKLFCAQRIIAALSVDSSISFSESKVLKSLLNNLIATHAAAFSEEQTQVLVKYCGASVNQQQQNWNWSMTAIEKVDTIRQSAAKDQLQQVEKVVFKMEALVQACIDSAMKVTRDVIDIQNKERRKLINQMKRTQEIDFYREWFELIQRMVHENAPWYNEELYPTTFELDETEGPGRMRIRLKRAVLEIEERFFLDEFKHKAQCSKKKPLLAFLLCPKETERYSIRDQIVFTFNGKHLTMEQEIEGEIIITDSQLIFLATCDTYNKSIICNIADIEEIWNRRYQHKEIALEIFLKCSKNFFIIFESNYERDIVNSFMIDKVDDKSGSAKVETLTQRWIENKMTNFEYLMELNKISGRSYNDLMQYNVMPWILVHYDSDILDLTSPETFRKLNKTISTQYENAEEHYVTNYRYLKEQMDEYQSIMKPYHYSSHYSNSGTVLHFLVRLPPYTNMFLHYQDNNFDIPDRTFHSLATTFRLSSKESATDVKELVPEFFFLPDFLENNEGFNYGRRQSGEWVDDVKLPEWCDNSPRLFTLIHRQALESDHVRRNLHQWIDLVFGFKQKGKAAIEAVNVFHPATYPEFQITNITDIVERSAYETMVRTYGQMPKQIFTSPHRKASLSERANETASIVRGVKGLKHGTFTGSLQLPKPKKLTEKTPIKCKQKNSRLVLVRDSNMFYVVPSSSCLMRGAAPNTFNLVLWKEIDGIVRTKSLEVKQEKRSRKLFSVPTCDPITTCGADINYCHLWFGHASGNISVYLRTDKKLATVKGEGTSKAPMKKALESILDIRVDANASSKSAETRENRKSVKSWWHFPIILLQHRGEVVHIKICTDFKIAVSIGSDGRTVIWDSQKIEYIQTIEPSCNSLRACLTHVDVSPTLGDILTVFKPKDGDEPQAAETNDECFEITEQNGDDFINVSVAVPGKSQLRLHNINGKYINHVFVEGIVTAVCFSFVKEGTGMNVIAAAFTDNSVRLFSTWNMAMIRDIATGCESPIKEISYSTNQYLILLTDQEIHLWGSDGLLLERPNFHDIVFVT